jgi:hypothetical protein
VSLTCKHDSIKAMCEAYSNGSGRRSSLPRFYEERGCRLRILIPLEHQASVEIPKARPMIANREASRGFWRTFLGVEVGEPDEGIVEEYANSLGKLLPKDSKLDADDIVGATRER